MNTLKLSLFSVLFSLNMTAQEDIVSSFKNTIYSLRRFGYFSDQSKIVILRTPLMEEILKHKALFFGKDVSFVSAETLIEQAEPSFIDISQLEINGTQAQLIFNYRASGYQIDLRFYRDDVYSPWLLLKREIARVKFGIDQAQCVYLKIRYPENKITLMGCEIYGIK